jgi:hypothetical protein
MYYCQAYSYVDIKELKGECMQDDQIGPKIVGTAPADMAILPPSIITKK